MKVDLKKQLPWYRAPRVYADAVAAIFGAAYKLKFFSKVELDRDYVVMPLEGLWWSDDMAAFTTQRDKSRWSWTMMSLVPEWIESGHVEAAREAVRAKAGSAALEALRLEELAEGRSVQTLHIGSYDDEAPVLDEMHHRFIPEAGLRMTGRHHEIYLTDPRRSAPERLRTILRQPVEALAGG